MSRAEPNASASAGEPPHTADVDAIRAHIAAYGRAAGLTDPDAAAHFARLCVEAALQVVDAAQAARADESPDLLGLALTIAAASYGIGDAHAACPQAAAIIDSATPPIAPAVPPQQTRTMSPQPLADAPAIEAAQATSALRDRAKNFAASLRQRIPVLAKKQDAAFDPALDPAPDHRQSP